MSRQWIVTGLAAVALLSGCTATEAAEGTRDDTPVSGAAEAALTGDGTWQVGTDVEPGVYVAEGGEGCMWQRIGYSAEVNARGLLTRPVVEITEDDATFVTESCGAWTAVEDYTAPEGTEIADNGIWIVGQDLAPGTYEAEGGDLCMWQRLSALTPDLDSVIRMGADPEVTIKSGDLAFLTTDCGSWTRSG